MTHAGPLVVIGDALLDRDVDGTASPLAPTPPRPCSRASPKPGGRVAPPSPHCSLPATGARWS